MEHEFCKYRKGNLNTIRKLLDGNHTIRNGSTNLQDGRMISSGKHGRHQQGSHATAGKTHELVAGERELDYHEESTTNIIG